MRLPSDFEVLRLRDFRLVYGASLVSLLGDGILPVALAFAVLDLTGSATDLGIVLAAETLALLGGLVLGGVVADRVSRRSVMVAADLVRLVGQGVVGGLLISGDASVAAIAVSQALVGGATGFFNPASSGLLPAVAGPHLREANALRGIGYASSNILGPAVAGVLVVAIGPGYALLIDAGSYAVSALLLSRVSPRAGTVERGERAHFRDDLREGFGEVRARTWLWASLLVLALTNMVHAAFPVLGPLVAKRSLGGAGAWAGILAARAVGGLLGGAVLLRVAPARPLLVATLACVVTPIMTILVGIPAPLAVLVPVAMAAGFGPLVFNTLWETTVQRHVPPAALSRVSSYDWFGSLALSPVGFALVGPLAGAIGTSAALYVCGGIELAMLVALLSLPELRRLPPFPAGDAPADASPARDTPASEVD